MPRVSIIIPNRDCPLAGRAVEAAAAQLPEEDSEILVVGSDGPEVVRPSARVRLIQGDGPLSPGGARNLGVDHAHGDVLVFLDADCQPAALWLDEHLTALAEAPVVGGSVDFALNGNRWAVADNIASFHGLLSNHPPENPSGRPLGSLNLSMRRQAWDEVGGFDAELVTSEDHDWFFRARALGIGCAFEPEAVVRHAAVRATRSDLVEHARWYGRHFNTFRRKHPGVFDRGPTWVSPRRLRAAALPKAWVRALGIFTRHPRLLPALTCLPAVALFWRTWYRTVAAHWTEAA